MPLRTSTIATIVSTADNLGKLPTPIRKEWDRLAALQEKVRTFDPPAYSLRRAALAVLEADGDLMDDPGVQRAAISKALSELRPGLAAELDDQMTAFIETHGEAILDSLTKPFNAAAATIARCLDKLGDIALEDTKAAISKGGDSAQTWAEAQKADQAIDKIATAVKLMRRNPVDPRYRVLVIADIEPATFLDDQLTRVDLRAWDVARRGYVLSLADGLTLDERIGAIATEMQRREEHARGGFTREYRRTHGDGRMVAS